MPNIVCSAETDRAVYELARKYLLSFPQVREELLHSYLEPEQTKLRPSRINEIFKKLLESAQNANMKAGVIGKAVGGVANLGPVLGEFDPHMVTQTFSQDWEKLLDTIEVKLRPHGKVRRERQSLWPLYCRTVLSGAEFLTQFKDAGEFFEWVDARYQNESSRSHLPVLLSKEIVGFGFTLACDFLKELGYLDYAKPDIHVRTILCGIGLAPARADNYQVFEAVQRIASHCGVTPYHADKLLWLVGSGNFYRHPRIGSGGKIGTDRAAFIQMAVRELSARFTPD